MPNKYSAVHFTKRGSVRCRSPHTTVLISYSTKLHTAIDLYLHLTKPKPRKMNLPLHGGGNSSFWVSDRYNFPQHFRVNQESARTLSLLFTLRAIAFAFGRLICCQTYPNSSTRKLELALSRLLFLICTTSG